MARSESIEKFKLITDYFKPFPEKTDNFPKENKISFKSFQILQRLGHGAYGTVFLVKKKSNQKLYAMKVLNKKYLLDKKQLRYAVREKNIFKILDHPFLIKLHCAFQAKII